MPKFYRHCLKPPWGKGHQSEPPIQNLAKMTLNKLDYSIYVQWNLQEAYHQNEHTLLTVVKIVNREGGNTFFHLLWKLFIVNVTHVRTRREPNATVQIHTLLKLWWNLILCWPSVTLRECKNSKTNLSPTLLQNTNQNWNIFIFSPFFIP